MSDMITTFNTGRMYTNEGQVITAHVTPNGVVLFHDHSRGISGQLNWGWGTLDTDLQERVLDAYDNGDYTYCYEATQLKRTPVELIHYLQQDRR